MMTEPANTAAEPAYIARLALKAHPFRQEVEPSFFFYGDQIEQRFNLLSHLVRASEKVVFIFAGKGMGKTSVLKQLQYNAGDELRFCYFDAQTLSTPAQLLTECMRCFGVEETGSVEQQQRLLKVRLQRLRHVNIRPVLLLDNADKVVQNSDIETFIYELFAWKDDDNFLLQGVLTANSVVAEWDNLHGRLQRMDWPEVAESELPAYLMHRLRVAGYQGENLFNRKQLKQIYHHASGCPAMINQLAHQILLGNPSAPHVDTGRSVFLLKTRWLGIAFITVFLLLLLVFQDKINAFLTVSLPKEKAETATIETIVDDEPVKKVIASQKNKTVAKSKLDERKELVQLVAELEQAQHVTEKSPSTQALNSNDTSSPEKKSAESVPVLPSMIHDENWVMQQDSHAYTFQLMGSWQRDEVLDFINKYALTGDIAIFESLRNNRTWYALLYGVYPEKKQALEASKQWPAPLNTLPSWLRRFDSVQEQIRNKAIMQ